MHLAFEQSENENKTTFINKISADIDLQQAFPSTHIKKAKDTQKRGNRHSKKQQNTSYPDEERRGKQANNKNPNKTYVRQVTSNEGKWEGSKPFKITDESIAKRKMLGFKGKGIICFLCGSTKHIAPHCTTYLETKPTATPCKCGLFHAESVCKGKRVGFQGNNPPQSGRVVRN